jgi:hypothetical protein
MIDDGHQQFSTTGLHLPVEGTGTGGSPALALDTAPARHSARLWQGSCVSDIDDVAK